MTTKMKILAWLGVIHVSGWTYSRALLLLILKMIMLCKILFATSYISPMLPANLFFLTAYFSIEMLGKYIGPKTLILRLGCSKITGLGFVLWCCPIINIFHQWFPSFRCVVKRIPVACHLFSGECHWFKLDRKLIKRYLAHIRRYWFLQCVQICSKVRVFILMKKEFVWLVQVIRFNCPIGMFLISLQALTKVLFSFAVSPFGCYCSGKLFCTRFACAFVVALTLHGGKEGNSWQRRLW